MRPVIVQVPKGQGEKVLEHVKKFDGRNYSLLEGRNENGEQDIVLSFFSNFKVHAYINALEETGDLQITIFPLGVMPLSPPAEKASEQVKDIEPRSPIEILLSGLQSIGSWKGFIGYALIAGIIVWIGLYSNIIYLLVGAMLIAPFASPAMITAMATATGDWHLMKRGLLRYFISLGVTIGVCLLLSFFMGQQIASNTMVTLSQISSVTVLIALSAGAAGALNLVQSERDSLVSGAATGMLVAASLAPPAGIVGMAIAIGKWHMMKNGLFLLILQLAGINLTGSLIFRWFKLTPKGSRFHRGKKRILQSSLLLTTILIGILMWWQFSNSPDLQRSSKSQKANAAIHQVLESHPGIKLVESNVRFTKANVLDQQTLLCVVYLQKKTTDQNKQDETIKERITTDIQRKLNRDFKVTPLVNVIVLEPPEM